MYIVSIIYVIIYIYLVLLLKIDRWINIGKINVNKFRFIRLKFFLVLKKFFF